MTVKNFKLSREMLTKCIAAAIKENSVHMADVAIEGIYGVIPSGEVFSIHTVEVKLTPRAKPVARSLGKLRLAAFEGATL